MNPADEQIALFVIKAYVDAYDDNPVLFDQLSGVTCTAKGLLKRKHILTNKEIDEEGYGGCDGYN